MLSRPSSLPGPLVMLVVLAAPVLVLSLILRLVLVASQATLVPPVLLLLLPWRVRCWWLAYPLGHLATRL